MGRKTEEQLPMLYRDSRALILPSRREGLPITLLEAGACGAICIGSRTPGIPEIIEEGVTGYLVAPDSPKELAETIMKTFQLFPDQRTKFQMAARERIASEYSEDCMIARYISLYETMLS
jgi:glycosyltransferase involved in cell wall biosynthesis